MCTMRTGSRPVRTRVKRIQAGTLVHGGWCAAPYQRSSLTILLTHVYSMPVANMPMTNSTPRDLFPGALEMMILESLRRQPAHGYALVQHIQQRSNNLLQVEEGSLYPALQRLLKAKLVKAEWGVSSTNRRVSTYQITALRPSPFGEADLQL